MGFVILFVSVVMQLIAVGLALRLIHITGRPTAWLFLSSAIVLMAVRRLITLASSLASDVAPPPDPLAESVGLIISILMVAGIAAIGPVFRRIVRAEEDARESESRFRQITENTNQVVWLTDWINRRELYVSPSYETVFGRPCASVYQDRMSWKDLVHPDDRPLVDQAFTAAAADAGEVAEATYRIVRDDGTIRWVWDRAFPVRDEHGRVYRIVGIAQDVTDRQRAERRQRVLNDELDHRVKNNLATVLALADETVRSSSSLDEFSRVFEGRIVSLAATHEALARSKWDGVDVRRLLEMTLAATLHGRNDRIELSGPNVVLASRACGPLTLTIHELLTNALRHGSLSGGGGLRVSWINEHDEQLRIRWAEYAGPRVRPPQALGTGTTLMRGFIEHELGGRLTLEYRPDGLMCTIELPLRLLEESTGGIME